MLFEELSLSKSIQRALIDQGYTNPTPIQEQAIPIVLAGEDIIGCAQTGTGKTAAFAIPIIHQLHRIVGSTKAKKKIRALVVTPTRELAIQIGQSFDTYGKYTNLKQLTIFGGVSQNAQVENLTQGIDILIATPGRLLDLHKQGFINLDDLHVLVLDEADQMLDMGFVNDVKKIVKLTPNNRQTLFFSATMPIAIRELAALFLRNPKSVTVTPVSSTAEKVSQQVYFVEKGEKRNLLYHLLQDKSLTDVLIFTRTKHGADNIVKLLRKKEIAAEAIHGDKSQNARQRVLEAFKNKEVGVLVATDIAARGIDIDLLPYVINFDIPNMPEVYVHRIGRTGRAGNGGLAISLCSKDEHGYWKDILRLINVDVKVIEDHNFKWHSGSPDSEGSIPPKQNHSNRSGEKVKSRKSAASKQNKKRWY
jgi:ATP-dependent RNA helicase RhlE